jgi:hypothetical protein
MKPSGRLFLINQYNLSPHGQQGRNPTDTAVNGSRLQIIPRAAAAPAGTPAACCLAFSSDPNLQPFSVFLPVPKAWKSHGERSRLYETWSYTFQYMEHNVSWTLQPTCGWMTNVAVQHEHIRHKYNGGMVLEGFTISVCNGDDIREINDRSLVQFDIMCTWNAST